MYKRQDQTGPVKTTLIDNDLTLAVEDAIPASPVYAPEEILALAVCASPNGSRDAGDPVSYTHLSLPGTINARRGSS